MLVRWVTGNKHNSSLQKSSQQPLCLRHQECFWFSSKQAMGRRAHGQVLYSMLLVRGFRQGMGSQISGCLMSTDVHLPSAKAGCLPPPNPVSARLLNRRNDTLTGMSLKVEGGEGESCP